MANPLAAAVSSATRELELAWATEEERELELSAAERYARDPFLLADEGHVWIYDKFKRATGRLALYETQRELLGAWIRLDHLERTGELLFRNVVDEKSRQMGETWGVAYALLWAMHFHVRSLFAHHYRAAEIDDGGERNTWRSLFGKIRYMDRRLGSPSGLADPRAREAVAGIGRLTFRPRSDTPARVENTATGAVLYGGEQTADPGRGGTFDGLVVDEAAFVPWGEKVHAALDEACPEGKLYLSTVNGDDNVHARIADERPRGWVKLRHHWSSHPLYAQGLHVAGLPPSKQPDAGAAKAARGCKLCAGNKRGLAWDPHEPKAHRFPGRLASPWYDERVIGKTDEQVAQELDIDRERALGGRVYREFQSELHVVEAGIDYDPAVSLELAFDYGLDCTSVIVLQDPPEELRAIALLEMGDLFKTPATPDEVAKGIRSLLRGLGVEEKLLVPQWTGQIRAIGDPAGEGRSLDTGRPWVEAYHKQGFRPEPPPSRYTRTVEPSITAVKRLLLGTPKPFRICGVKAEELATHLRNNTWPTDVLGRRKPGSTRPLDNVHNHSCRALAYYAVAKYPPPLEHDEYAHPVSSPDEQTGDGLLDPGLSYGMSL